MGQYLLLAITANAEALGNRHYKEMGSSARGALGARVFALQQTTDDDRIALEIQPGFASEDKPHRDGGNAKQERRHTVVEHHIQHAGDNQPDQAERSGCSELEKAGGSLRCMVGEIF